MIRETRRARAWALAVCTAACLALTAQAEGDAPRLTGVVNVNTASTAELQLLPGIGASRAQAVVELRKQRGGFQSLEELKQVKGIGDASLERMRPYVSLQGRTTARIE
jgi:competence protein ComEA